MQLGIGTAVDMAAQEGARQLKAQGSGGGGSAGSWEWTGAEL